MKNQYFHNVVKKMKKFRHKVITIKKIKNTIHSILDNQYSDSKTYKIIYHLKNKGYIISIKKDMFLVKMPQDDYDEQKIADKFYRDAVRIHSKEQLSADRYIGGIKALELNINNFSIPEEIDIYTKEKNSTDTALLDKKIFYKTYNHKGKNLRTKIKPFTHMIRVQNRIFRVATIELSLLESLYSPNIITAGYANELIKKILKKYKKKLQMETFTKLLRMGKHHTSINRLYQLALHVDQQLADSIKDIIKKEGFILAA